MASSSPSSLIERRREQMFPVLNPAQVEIAQRFNGEPRRFKPDEIVFEVGQAGVPAYLVLSGSIQVVRRDGLGHESEITTHGPGELTGDISQLEGGVTLTQGRAGVNGAEAVPFDSARLRSLVIATSEIGEAIMRAFILRRAFLIEAGAGLVLLGASDTPVALRLQNFLRRNFIPYTMLDPGVDADAASLIEHLGISQAELPLAVCPNGTILRSPHEKTLAHCLGLLPSFLADRSYDVAIVGAGPAGLATAVYAGSEGLSVLVLDAQAPGGQAGASARIENYLGFPTGISGASATGSGLHAGAEVRCRDGNSRRSQAAESSPERCILRRARLRAGAGRGPAGAGRGYRHRERGALSEARLAELERASKDEACTTGLRQLSRSCVRGAKWSW